MNSNAPQAALNYVLYDERMRVVRTFGGKIQVDGEGVWSSIGTGDELLEIPEHGTLVVYISNSSIVDVFFDKLKISISKGTLREETHYYPHGLPMAHAGAAAIGSVLNRQKHQSNEYLTEAGLRWMDFHFRQYDPQLGRFLGIDPLAHSDGQEVWSPYTAMGCQPESSVDPNGLSPANDRLHVNGADILISDYSRGYENFLRNEAIFFSNGIEAGGGFGGGWNGGYNSYGSLPSLINQALARGGNTQLFNNYNGSWSVFENVPSSHFSVSKYYSNEYFSGGNVGYNGLSGVISAVHYVTTYNGSNKKQSNGGWVQDFGKWNALLGLGFNTLQESSSTYRITSQGYGFSPWLYSKNYPASPYFNSYSVAKLGKGLGYFGAGLGLAVDIRGMWIYKDNPKSPNAVHPGKAALNTGMAAYGIWINPIAGGAYSLMDAFYPGGWLGALRDYNDMYQINHSILGSKWRLTPFGPK